MRSPAFTSKLAKFAFALVAVASCSGEKVRLGDAFAGGNAGEGEAARAGAMSNGASGGASGGSMGDQAGSSGSDAGAACETDDVSANEVVWIGDTWITIPGDQYLRVTDRARDAGAIEAGEEYVVRAAPYAAIADIARQYESHQAGPTKARVLIMDGGTWDTIGDDSALSVATTVDTFERLLSQVASDGTVEHIIYFLVPELPMIPGVAALRPGMQRVCAESDVPCHFIDLQRFWVGHPEYTSVEGLQASRQGAIVIADEIWRTMRDNCIAQ